MTCLPTSLVWRIIHNTEASIQGLPFNGNFGIDNIRAIVVPEPSAFAAVVALLVAFAGQRAAARVTV